MRTRTAIALFSACFAASAATPKTPSRDVQTQVIAAARRAALAYDQALPDFVCAEAISRYSDATGKGKYWSAVDSLMALLSYYGRQEHYRLVQFNHQPDSEGYDALSGATSRGEFGGMLRRVFDPAFAASFTWVRWDEVRGTRVQVYSYQVLRERSNFSLDYVNGPDEGRIVAGYHGLVYIDPAAAATLRITVEADGLKEFQITLASTTLDYDYAAIAGRAYLLPLQAVTLMRAGEVMTKNVVDFESYQKFEAGSNVLYPKAEGGDNKAEGEGKKAEGENQKTGPEDK
ncbi:MAG TPA: hypothetical protein VMU19_15550 [Bryobacteraceae bacterium]|nr:hypothetical protein [Bryobacteraceae bacterium]